MNVKIDDTISIKKVYISTGPHIDSYSDPEFCFMVEHNGKPIRRLSIEDINNICYPKNESLA